MLHCTTKRLKVTPIIPSGIRFKSSYDPNPDSSPSKPPFPIPCPPHLNEHQFAKLVDPPHGRWTFNPNPPTSLSRTFQFPTFHNAWAFMKAIALDSKSRRHHPEWSNSFRTVYVRWTTHKPKPDPKSKVKLEPGVMKVDLDMCEVCDEKAREWEEVLEEKGGEGEGVAQELVERVVKQKGDCCGVGMGKGGKERTGT